MPIIHVSLGFAKLSDAGLDEFASNTVFKMTGNASFATPDVPLTAMTAGQVAFHTALAAMTNGGKAATAAKNTARGALLGLLRQQAAYVETTAAGNLAVLLSAGFIQRGAPSGASPLVKPSIKSLANGNSTQLLLTVVPVANAKAYEAQVRIGTGAWTTVVTSTKSRGIVLPGLVPGTMYDVQVRAIGGSTGYSDWSDAVSHMCM